MFHCKRVLTASAVLLALAVGTLSGQEQGKDKDKAPVFRPGSSHKNVACQAAPQYHYDLRVPKGYRPGQPTPVLYVFSPRGRVPMQLFRAAADELGWIVCGSVESRNGMQLPQYNAIFAALHAEMTSRFTVHPHRTYFTGMSGGSRVAFALFSQYGEIASGVIGMAAGRSGPVPPKVPGGAVAGLVGYKDFNYLEFVGLNERLGDQGISFKLMDWDGNHQWAPAALIGQAAEWLEFQYFIRSPHLTDKEKTERPKRVESFLKKTAKAGATMEAYETYETLSKDLQNDKPWLQKVTAAMEKLEPELKSELSAREAFREAYKPFGSNRTTEKAILGLQGRMKQVAADHGTTAYGKRAGVLAGAIDRTLAMIRWQKTRRRKPPQQ
jgi:predicted esterase